MPVNRPVSFIRRLLAKTAHKCTPWMWMETVTRTWSVPRHTVTVFGGTNRLTLGKEEVPAPPPRPLPGRHTRSARDFPRLMPGGWLMGDRKSVVEGKSVTVRIELGGR